jgi:hypothetical protein
MKRILSLFIAAVIVCIALPVTASSTEYQWGANENHDLYGNNIVTVSNDSSGYITAFSGTTTITGNATLSDNLVVYIQLGASVLWEANVTGTAKITFTGAGTATITGSIENTGGTAVETSANLIINGGTITGTTGINCLDGTITINSGTITSTGNGGNAAVDITMGSYDPVVTIGGTAVINSGLAAAVRIGNNQASLLITNGTISSSGNNALYSSVFNSLNITGGSFSSSSGNAIYQSVTQAMTIAPTASTPITIQGNLKAIAYHDSTPIMNNTYYYYASDNYNGTGKVLYDNSRYGFSFPTDYKYVQFWAVNPDPPIESEPEPEQPDTSTPPHLVTYAPSYNPPAIPEVIPIYAPKEMNIDVIAITNKSGSVDSAKTRLEVLRAARTKGVTQITLILPEDCKGISTAAIKKCVKAAGNTPMLLSYDDVKIKLTENTKQVLTKLYYKTK